MKKILITILVLLFATMPYTGYASDQNIVVVTTNPAMGDEENSLVEAVPVSDLVRELGIESGTVQQIEAEPATQQIQLSMDNAAVNTNAEGQVEIGLLNQNGVSLTDMVLGNPSVDGGLSFDNSWVNLTYKGGLQEYEKKVASNGIMVFGPGMIIANPQHITGYIVGKPYVPPTPPPAAIPNPAPEADVKEEPVKEEPVKEEPVKEESVKEEPVKEESAALTTADVTAINSSIMNLMKFAVSTREETKVTTYVLNSQTDTISGKIKAKNEAILKLDDGTLEQQGVEAIKKMMSNWIKSDKLKVSQVNPISATEVVADVQIPVYSFGEPDKDLKAKMSADVKYSLKNLGELLSDPLGAKTKLDATVYDDNMKYMAEMLKAAGTIDMYSQYPSAYKQGTMKITLKKEGTSWKVDATTLKISAEMAGTAETIVILG